MAINSLQEKFQVSIPHPKPEDGEGWVFVDSILKTVEIHQFNRMPSTEIRERMLEKQGMRLVTAGESDVTNVQSAKCYQHGFTLHDMDGVDDQYTGEHVDHFYGEAAGTDDAGHTYTGFVERNNYLDRE